MVKSNRCFEDLYDYVRIEESWLSQVKNYITLDEAEPERHCKSKQFIIKVKFMAAVAGPLCGRKQYFKGKIGLWPFVYKVPAKRNSKNRARGAIVTKNIEYINAAECKKMILPAIRSKFPEAHKA
ncbi:hypothetical protein Trydic_g10311 [Trypoxylus dichotomus]